MRSDRRLLRIAVALGWGAVSSGAALAADPSDQAAKLRPVAAFSGIEDSQARSVALFTEAAKAIASPRCLNCHPVKRLPTQGNDLHAHTPPMAVGDSEHGIPGLPCTSCHGLKNFETAGARIASIPGAPMWALAPVSMAWQGKSLHEICEQLKDPKRNGGRSLDAIQKHMGTDPTVGWAWHPGPGRMPAPGTQEQLGQLIQAWISTGAQCPQS
jgi:hypothetical protein